eukprot:scpid81417/ scgid23521/ 
MSNSKNILKLDVNSHCPEQNSDLKRLVNLATARSMLCDEQTVRFVISISTSSSDLQGKSLVSVDSITSVHCTTNVSCLVGEIALVSAVHVGCKCASKLSTREVQLYMYLQGHTTVCRADR